jgi:hypothetical protein
MQPNSLSIVTRAAVLVAVSAAAFGVGAQTATPGNTPLPVQTPSAEQRGASDIAFVRADMNKDGKVSRDEATKLPAMSGRFAELDRDKDGNLSKDEFTTGYTAKP